MFEQYSVRSRRGVFLARMDASRRGAAAIEPAHLLVAIIRENQAEVPAWFPEEPRVGRQLQPQRSFFSRGIASQILSLLERVLPPQGKPVADSADMECSPALDEVFTSARALAKELHHDKVEPLHLVAAMLSTETGEVDEILRRVGISREAVIAAIQS